MSNISSDLIFGIESLAVKCDASFNRVNNFASHLEYPSGLEMGNVFMKADNCGVSAFGSHLEELSDALLKGSPLPDSYGPDDKVDQVGHDEIALLPLGTHSRVGIPEVYFYMIWLKTVSNYDRMAALANCNCTFEERGSCDADRVLQIAMTRGIVNDWQHRGPCPMTPDAIQCLIDSLPGNSNLQNRLRKYKSNVKRFAGATYSSNIDSDEKMHFWTRLPNLVGEHGVACVGTSGFQKNHKEGYATSCFEHPDYNIRMRQHRKRYDKHGFPNYSVVKFFDIFRYVDEIFPVVYDPSSDPGGVYESATSGCLSDFTTPGCKYFSSVTQQQRGPVEPIRYFDRVSSGDIVDSSWITKYKRKDIQPKPGSVWVIDTRADDVKGSNQLGFDIKVVTDEHNQLIDTILGAVLEPDVVICKCYGERTPVHGLFYRSFHAGPASPETYWVNSLKIANWSSTILDPSLLNGLLCDNFWKSDLRRYAAVAANYGASDVQIQNSVVWQRPPPKYATDPRSEKVPRKVFRPEYPPDTFKVLSIVDSPPSSTPIISVSTMPDLFFLDDSEVLRFLTTTTWRSASELVKNVLTFELYPRILDEKTNRRYVKTRINSILYDLHSRLLIRKTIRATKPYWSKVSAMSALIYFRSSGTVVYWDCQFSQLVSSLGPASTTQANQAYQRRHYETSGCSVEPGAGPHYNEVRHLVGDSECMHAGTKFVYFNRDCAKRSHLKAAFKASVNYWVHKEPPFLSRDVGEPEVLRGFLSDIERRSAHFWDNGLTITGGN
jgi:hypothetical protein